MEYISNTLGNLVDQTAFMNLTFGNLIMIAVACVFLYLAIGATAPFFHYKTIPDKTKEQFSSQSFYQDGPGVDRAMILETNESAWEERIRRVFFSEQQHSLVSLPLILERWLLDFPTRQQQLSLLSEVQTVRHLSSLQVNCSRQLSWDQSL